LSELCEIGSTIDGKMMAHARVVGGKRIRPRPTIQIRIFISTRICVMHLHHHVKRKRNDDDDSTSIYKQTIDDFSTSQTGISNDAFNSVHGHSQ